MRALKKEQPQLPTMALDFYWRDYRGSIPEDAVVGAIDSDGENLYIGQVYVQSCGLYVGKIKQGAETVEVAAYGVRHQRVDDNLVKIMCTSAGHQDKFNWKTTTTSTFFADTIGCNLIPGGYDHVANHGVLYVGRCYVEGRWEFGSIRGFDENNPYLSVVDREEEHRENSFQVLIYGPCDNK